MISATERNTAEIQERELNLESAISNFALILSSASKGDLTRKVDLPQIPEEYRPIGENINTMTESMKSLINEAESTGSSVTTAVREMATNLREMSDTAQQIAGAISQIAQGSSSSANLSQQMQKLSDDLKVLMKNVASASEILRETADGVAKQGAEGEDASNRMRTVSNTFLGSMGSIAETSENLNRNIQSIAEVIEIITSIADQTNLLALNAAIEAARAGEQGKAFSVVADEIRKLADQSRNSIQRIRAMIDSISHQREKMMEVVQKGKEDSRSTEEIVNITTISFQQIIQGVSELTSAIKEIFEMINRESETVDELAKGMEEASAIAEENAASVEESTASIEEQTASIEELVAKSNELTVSADDLMKSLDRFKR
ncbi:MAG: Sensory rhodopsin I transducer [Candidatus Methanolliviera sp. GoM_oil]|nr:MAG: Sensory rhodopsin I transducer [Candidatus Methanolliviera sp. GoM_oil]